MPRGAIEFVTRQAVEKKGFSQPAYPSVVSPAGGELKERGHLLRRVVRATYWIPVWWNFLFNPLLGPDFSAENISDRPAAVHQRGQVAFFAPPQSGGSSPRSSRPMLAR